MGENHTSAAIAGEADAVKCLDFLLAFAEEGHVFLPEVAGNLAAREATDGDDHFEGREWLIRLW